MITSAILIGGLLAIGGCQTTTPEVKLSTAEVAALQGVWLGKRWEGSWGGSCTGAVEVLEVDGNEAEVRYEWGQCGDFAPGDFLDDNAVLTPTEMKLVLFRGTTANYVLQPDGSLRGSYANRRGAAAEGSFEPVGGS